MTAEFVPTALGLQAVLYDGTNGADVVAGLTGSTFTSDASGVLDFMDHQPLPQQFTAPWWIFRGLSDGMFNGAAQSLALAGHQDLTEIIAAYAPLPALVQSSGSASVPASLLGQTVDYDATMSPALPDASYVPVAVLRGAPNVVSGHGITGVAVIDAGTVRVTVQSGAASLAGASVHVTAYALA